MTPISDWAKAIRRRLITDRRNPAQAHYQALIAKGLSEVDAANMSGWHPMIDTDNLLRNLAKYLILLCAAGLLLVWVNGSHALMDAREQVAGCREGETAMADCMNKKEVAWTDGTRWACFRLEDRK